MPHGPYRVLGDPHPDDPTHTSFHSQISCVFRVENKKDLYIAVADRWFPEHMDIPYESYAKVLREMFDPEATEESREKAKDGLRFLPVENSAVADYVWLPVRFEGDMCYLAWKEEWRLSDYEDAQSR